ncbi:MAG: DUF2946 family protein [Proteobacteria bacterium]|nr:DUF2946 family protein [Pseudomonadota bacterium]
MPAARCHRRLSTWIALAAMLAFALVPTLSRALAFAAGNGTAWAEVCTPQGLKLVSTAAADADGGGAPASAPAQALSLDPCSFCSLAGAGLAPPPAVPPLVSLPLRGAAPPPLFLQAPRTLHAWASAQPRAPPVIA